MGAKDIRLGQEREEYVVSELAWERRLRSNAANTSVKWQGLLQDGGGARWCIDNHTATLFALRIAC